MELSTPPSLSNSGPSRVMRSLHGEVLTGSPIVQKKKEEKRAYLMGNKVKEMVHNSKSNNSDKMVTVAAVKNVRDTLKAIPLQAWTGPEGSRSLRLPDFKTIGT